MNDPADAAQAYEELNIEQAMRAHAERAKLTTRPRAIGSCLLEDCAEDFGDDRVRLFCGAACADKYDRTHNRR